MYSVVLMMAMTGGGDVQAGLFHHGCTGGSCYGNSCYGGSCYGGCTGGKHHGRTRGHGCTGASCYGGCTGNSYGCCGGGKHHGRTRSYGCCGGGKHMGHHRGHGCCGGGCYGYNSGSCYGGSCYGSGMGGVGAGCIGGGIGIGAPIVPGTQVIPTTPTTPKTPVNPKKTGIETAAPATLVINVPAEAKLTIDGEATTSTSTQRVFVSPILESGRDYHYTVKVEFVKEGKVVSVSKQVAVRAGNETRVTLDAENLSGVASR